MNPEKNKSQQSIGFVCLIVLCLDQMTKLLVSKCLALHEQHVIIDGFFKLVYWGNTGAAWSMFLGKNTTLAIISLIALVILFWNHEMLGSKNRWSCLGLGLMTGGIAGNLIDRFRVRHVIDFIYFYLERRGGEEIGFPAFNVADSAICVGVGIMFIWSYYSGQVNVEEATGSIGPTDKTEK